MKAHILKLSGAKNEKDFYKMFPTQESFMAKYGKELHQLLKMQGGDKFGFKTPNMMEAQPIQQPPQTSLPNMQQYLPSGIMPPGTPKPVNTGTGDTNRNGIPDYLEGADAPVNTTFGPKNSPYPTAPAAAKTSPWETIGNMIPGVGKIVGGFKALKAEKEALRGANQWNQVSAKSLEASKSVDVNARTDIANTQRKKRDALMRSITGEELFPVQGVGTNVLTKYGGKMNHGGEIMNTFDPIDVYEDLGFEPFNESNQVKSFAHGGRAAGGFDFGSMLGAGGDSSFDFAGAGNAAGSLTSNLFGNNAGAQIGGGVADTLSVIPGVGPIAGAIAKPLFSAIGGMFDRNPKKTEIQQKQMMGNVANMSGTDSIKGYQNQYSGVFRTGGNLRTNSVGDIEAVSGGYLEPISYNPHTPGSGITSMIKGQSHDESNGRHSGVIMNYSGNSVEAERGEPISEREDGGSVGNTSAVIAGDQTFNKLGTSLYPDLAKYQGQKVKNINAEIAKDDARLNKFEKKNKSDIADLEERTPLDKLTKNSYLLNQQGIEEQYAANASKANNLLEYQDAVNQTAQEWGVDAGDLSRGKLKFNNPITAKNGGLLKAQYGNKTRDQYLKERGQAMAETPSNTSLFDFMFGGAKETPKKPLTKAEKEKQMKGAQEFQKMLNTGNVFNPGMDFSKLPPPAKQAAKQVAKQAPAKPIDLSKDILHNRMTTKKAIYPQVPPGMAEQKMKDFIEQISPGPLGTFKDPFGVPKKAPLPSANPVAGQSITAPAETARTTSVAKNTDAAPVQVTQARQSGQPQRTTGTPGTAGSVAPARPAATPTTPVGGTPPASVTGAPTSGYVSKYGLEPWMGNVMPGNKYGKKTASSFTGEQWDQIAENLGFTGKGNEEFQKFLLNHPESKPLIEGRHKELYGTSPFIDKKLGYGWAADDLLKLKKAGIAPTTAQTTTANPNYEVTPYKKAGWETLAGQILPWMRKTPGEPLQGDQLAGEMYALSNNQVEPVQANFYHPQLDVPYDISLQDQLNENQADFNSMQRAAGNNPEALAALAAQKYSANSKVLGEQFRMNQGMKNQVYSGNRATLNDAQMKNLQIADQQYGRQAQAKSNTKLATQEALNSISSKIGQNRLENRTLQTYSNMFPQYSYDKNFNILNTGAPASFDVDQGIYSPRSGNITHVPVYDAKGKIIGMQPTAPEKTPEEKKAEEKKSRQGSIVKAFKNL